MADELKQTLYFSADPDLDITAEANTGAANFTNVITAAETHDASDLTYTSVYEADDNATPLNANATGRMRKALDTANVSGTISFIRIKYRGKRANLTNISGTIQPCINDTARGSADTMTTAYTNYSQDFATDPADAGAWTNGKINGQTFGVFLHAESTAVAYNRTPETFVSEFSVEVWGPPAAQESTPATVAATATAATATGVPGAVASTPATVTVTTEPAEVGSQELFTMTAPRNPMAVTTLERRVLRVDHANLGDGDLQTIVADVTNPAVGPFPNPAGGTVKVSASALKSPGAGELASWRDIHHIRLGALAYQVDNLNPAPPANRRFFYTHDGTPYTAAATVHASVTTTVWYRDDNDVDPGLAQPFPEYYVWSADMALDPDGNPWTAATIMALSNIGLGHDYPAAHEWNDVRVSELFVEVYGAMGPSPDPIRVTSTFVQPRLMDGFPTLREGDQFPDLKGVGKVPTIRRQMKFGGT